VPTERQGRLPRRHRGRHQHLADEFEELIRAAPEQWHLLQPKLASDGKAGSLTGMSRHWPVAEEMQAEPTGREAEPESTRSEGDVR